MRNKTRMLSFSEEEIERNDHICDVEIRCPDKKAAKAFIRAKPCKGGIKFNLTVLTNGQAPATQTSVNAVARRRPRTGYRHFWAIPNDETIDGDNFFYPSADVKVPFDEEDSSFVSLRDALLAKFESAVDKEDYARETKGFWIVDDEVVETLRVLESSAAEANTGSDGQGYFANRMIKIWLGAVCTKQVGLTINGGALVSKEEL